MYTGAMAALGILPLTAWVVYMPPSYMQHSAAKIRLLKKN
jgi:hypothetical protein